MAKNGIIASPNGVQVTSNKNNTLSRIANSSSVMDEVTFGKIKSSMIGSISRGTEAGRRQIDGMKSVIVSNNKQINDSAATLDQAIPRLKVGPGALEQNMLDLINTGVFFVLNPNGQSAASKKNKLSKLINATKDFLGTRENSPLVRIVKAINNAEYKELARSEEDELVSDDGKFFQFVLDAPSSKQEVSAKATKFIEDTMASWDGEEGILGFPSLSEFASSDATTQGQPRKVYMLYRYEVDTDASYFYVTVKVKLKADITDSGFLLSTIKGVEVDKSAEEAGALVKIEKVQASSLDRKTKRLLIEADKQYRNAGSSVLEYGHLISAGQVVMLNVAADLEVLLANTPPDNHGFVRRLTNFKTTLQNIIKVTQKLDGLVESWTASTEGVDALGITNKDILAILASTDTFDPGQIYIYEKTDPLSVPSRKGSIGRSVTYTMATDGGDITVTGPLVAIMERKKFNAAKGVVTKQLLNLMRKQLEGDMENILTEQDIIDSLTGNLVVTTASDSILTGGIKQVIGGKVDTGKGKQSTIKIDLPKQKMGRALSNLVSMKAPSSIVKAGKSVKRNPTPGSGSGIGGGGGPKGPKGPKGNNLPPAGMIGRINAVLETEIKSRMNPPRLQNRKGRFAESVEVVSIEDALVRYRFEYNPYNVFSAKARRTKWNRDPARDPDKLIIDTLNDILASYTPSTMYTYTRG